MDVAHAILATAAEMTDDGKVHLLNGGLDTIGGAFPGPLLAPLYLAVKLLLDPTEAQTSHRALVEILNSDGDGIIYREEAELRPSPPGPLRRPPTAPFLLRMRGLLFPVLGHYKVRISVDGREVKSLPLVIRRYPDDAPKVQP